MRNKILRISAVLFLFTVLIGQAVNGAQPSSQLVIKSAEADYGSGQITIKGVNFGTALPAVTLADDPLLVLSATPNEIVTLMPPLLPARPIGW